MAKRITDENLNLNMTINGGDKAMKALGDLQSSYRKLKDEEEDLRKAKQKLIAEGKKESAAYDKIKKDLEGVKAQMNENKDEQEEYRKEIGLAALSVNELTKRQRALKAQMNAVSPKTEDWNQWNSKLKETQKRLKDVRDEMGLTKEEMMDSSEAGEQLMVATSDIFQGLRAGNLQQANAGLVVMRGNMKALTAQAWAFVTTPIGATLAAIAIAIGAFKVWHDYNKNVREAAILTERLTNLQGDAADKARTHAKALEETFGADFKETLKSAKAISKEFEIEFSEAMDKIEAGLIKGGAANDEYFDSMREYSTFFAQAGYSAEEFINIVNTGFDLGIYNDKLPDALKEADLSLKEQTKTTRDALVNAFGAPFTDEILEKVRSGEMTTKDALVAISEQSEKTGINTQQNAQLTADVFRGAGEDAGGALKVFEAVNKSYEEQTRALTPLEEQVRDVAAANRELEEAQDRALKSDKYIAFTNEIEVSWIKFKTSFFNGVDGLLNGLLDADTAIRKFFFQTVQYTKTAFSGDDADWDKIGARFDEIERKRRKAAEDQRKEEQKRQENKNGGTGNTDSGDEYQAELEAAKKAAEKRAEDLRNLEEKFYQERENRLAESNEARALLEKERQIQEAKSLGAGQDLINKINEENQIKIDAARTQDEEIELERIAEFEAKKKALKDEIALKNAESDKEKDLLAAEQKFEEEEAKLEAEMERLELSEFQKNELRILLQEKFEATKTEIEARHLAIRDKQDQEFKEKQLKREIDLKDRLASVSKELEDAKSNAQQRGFRILLGFFDKKSGIYKALFALEKGVAIAQVINQGAKSLAEITANTASANLKAVNTSPLTAGMPWTAINTAIGLKEAATVKLNTALQVATIGATAIKGIKGYEEGLYPDYLDVTRTDGKRFRARNMGNAGTRIVNEPSYFRDNNYLAGENGTEMIIDNAVFRQLSPKVINSIIDTRNRVKGFESGMYKTGTTSQASEFGNTDPELKAMLATLMLRLSEPIKTYTVYGYDEEEQRKKLEEEIDQSNNNGKITS